MDINTFMFAGNAIFTIQNSETGNRFTYKVRKHKEKSIYFVSVLTGSDNENNYTFIGTVFENGTFKLSQKSKLDFNTISVKAFVWFFTNRKSLPEKVKIYHAGYCGRCGRTLTTPESVSSGFGPECIKHIA